MGVRCWAFIVAQQGGTMGTTDMKAHVGRIAAVEAMAVDTTLELRVLNQWTLVERGEVTFINAHLAPHLVARLNETVADAVVDAVRRDIDGERLIGVPAVVIFGRDGDAERVASVLCKQYVPVVNIEVGGTTSLAVQAVSVAVGNDGINTQYRLIGH